MYSSQIICIERVTRANTGCVDSVAFSIKGVTSEGERPENVEGSPTWFKLTETEPSHM